MGEPSLTDLSIVDFLQRLGSEAPTPGGGSTAALVGALAAALGQKVARLTVGKSRFANVESQVRNLGERLARAESLLRGLMDEDATAYAKLSAALKRERSDPHRGTAVEQAAAVAGYVPLETAAACAAVLADLRQVRSLGNPALRSDAEAGVHLAQAALLAAAANVRVNLALMREGDATELERQLDGVLAKSVSD